MHALCPCQVIVRILGCKTTLKTKYAVAPSLAGLSDPPSHLYHALLFFVATRMRAAGYTHACGPLLHVCACLTMHVKLHLSQLHVQSHLPTSGIAQQIGDRCLTWPGRYSCWAVMGRKERGTPSG